MKGRTFTVEITVAQIWIDDGFDLTDEVMRDVIDTALPWANDDEIVAKVITKTDSE